MPKINVYLPDDLANAVREAKIPVSAVCQRALEDALRRATAAAESTRALEDLDDVDLPRFGVMTPRLKNVVALAQKAAREQKVNYVGTEHFLLGILDERGNLAVRVLQSLDIEPDDLRRELEALIGQQKKVAKPTGPAKMTPLAHRAFELAAQQSVGFFHNYVGCEHLLLGLVIEEEGMAGRVLRSMGVDKTVARRAVVTALSGFVHARQELGPQPPINPPKLADEQLAREILDRLDAIERKLGT
jgi:ATP-dependent Clp protease ATP-binding subunit ClpA